VKARPTVMKPFLVMVAIGSDVSEFSEYQSHVSGGLTSVRHFASDTPAKAADGKDPRQDGVR